MVLTNTRAHVYGGQGTQQVGMGREIFEHSEAAKAIYRRASVTLGFSVEDLCFTDPKNVLRGNAETGKMSDPEYVQVALLVTHAAIDSALIERGVGSPGIVLGHSAGQYSGILRGEGVQFEELLPYVRNRGRMMREHHERLNPRIALAFGLDSDRVQLLLSSARKVLNLREGDPFFHESVRNTDRRSVLIGPGEPAEYWSVLLAEAEKLKAKIIPYFDVPASHTLWLKMLQRELNQVLPPFTDIKFPMISDISGRLMRKAKQLRANYRRHVITGVDWQGNVITADRLGVEYYVIIGPSKIPKGMILEIKPDASINTTDTYADFEVAVEKFAA